ncbi:MAG: type II secretion system protein [Acidobacteriota bacterium]|nr:MAG: type II secretion system protein [Acidobacteriota bacterium]
MLVRRREAFSLLELLFVILIIAIVAGLAIPSLLNSKKAGYEAATISYLRALGSAQEVYRIQRDTFASDFKVLAELKLVQEPDSEALGYELELAVVGTGQSAWWAVANPVEPGRTGDRYFYLDGTGVIRESLDGPADESSNPLNAAD